MMESQRSGVVVTFYSYKGGVGRSMALANVAALLSRWGQRVLLIDWDLEAPGLHKYFARWLVKPADLKEGIVDLVLAHRDGITLDWRSCIVPIQVTAGKEIHILTAGKDDDQYATRLRGIDWDRLFAEKRLGNYIEGIRRDWKEAYDFILVDSRTGVTDIGGICTIHLPDILVAMFTANEQSLLGVKKVLKSARLGHAKLPVDRRKLIVVPLPSRDESTSEHALAEHWRQRFASELDEFFKDWVPTGESNAMVLNFLKIPYFPYWSFGERIPVLEQEDPDNPKTLAYSFQPLARLLLGRMDWNEARQGTRATEEAQRLAAETEKARLESTRLAQEAQVRAEAKKTAELEQKEKERAERLASLRARIEAERGIWESVAKSSNMARWIGFLGGPTIALVVALPLVAISVWAACIIGLLLFVSFMLLGAKSARQRNIAKALAEALPSELLRYESNTPPYAGLSADDALTVLAVNVDGNLQQGALAYKEKARSYTWQPATARATPATSVPPAQPATSSPAGTLLSGPDNTAPPETPPADYQFDLYLSYSRTQVVSGWLDLFLPLLSFWLGEELGREPKIFWDPSSSGDRNALPDSRGLLAVFTPTYFESKACMAELRSFLAREGRPIVPVLFSGLRHIPEEARSLQIADFSQFAFTGDAFKSSPRYIDFQTVVQDLAPRVADTIRRAPPFQPDPVTLSASGSRPESENNYPLEQGPKRT